MHEAQFYSKIEGPVQCCLCPHQCIIQNGQYGICKVRTNQNGILYSSVYGKLIAKHLDPIEKKPLYHFHPGMQILSIGTIGCNFNCSFCQNHSISQCHPDKIRVTDTFSSKEITDYAKNIDGNIGIAYTYNEPIVFYEFLSDTARENHANGLKNVIVSNGYILPKPLKKLLPFIDAFNIDLKAFSNEFYKKHAKGKLNPVLQTLEEIVNSGKHLEVTNLVITDLNSNKNEFEKMVKWIASNLGKNIPLHISRYFPTYKLTNPPTPLELLDQFYEIAKNDLNYVYLGNVNDTFKSSTYCTNCGKLLIRRTAYNTEIIGIEQDKCLYCKSQVSIVS